MTIEEMRALLQQSLKPKRYEHSVRVYETALKMAEHYHADVKKVAVAALIHDCGRQVPKETSVAKAKDLGLPVDSVEEAQPRKYWMLSGIIPRGRRTCRKPQKLSFWQI